MGQNLFYKMNIYNKSYDKCKNIVFIIQKDFIVVNIIFRNWCRGDDYFVQGG